MIQRGISPKMLSMKAGKPRRPLALAIVILQSVNRCLVLNFEVNRQQRRSSVDSQMLDSMHSRFRIASKETRECLIQDRV